MILSSLWLTLGSPDWTCMLNLTDTEPFSGYKINADKSEALPVNIPEADVKHLTSCFPYAWKSTVLKYFGVFITPSFTTLYQENSPPPFIG